MDSRLEERRRKEREEQHEGHKHFAKEPPSDLSITDLRKKHVLSLVTDTEPRLSYGESLALLLQGNEQHASALKSSPTTPMQRYHAIKNGEADYLVVGCSDSRILRLDSEKDTLVGTYIRIAGNVVPAKGTASFDEMREAVQNVKKDGAIIFEGHDGGPGCGAVNEHVKWVNGGMPHSGSAPLDELLHRVVGDSPEMNAGAQLTMARHTLDLGDRPSAAIVYDWEYKKHGHEGAIHVVSENHSDVIEILKDNWNRTHEEIAHKSDIVKILKNQRPHSIAVGTMDLPYSIGTLFHAEQNEVFSTTGSEKGLDDLDMASILYAVEHLHVHHIPFVAPGEKGDEEKINKMFDLWENQLRSMTVHGEHLLAKMIDSGGLVITRFRYDLDNGKTVELPPPSLKDQEAA